MQMHNSEIVDGTQVRIGRRINRRMRNGKKTAVISKVYYAIYLDIDGSRLNRSLDTTNRQDARRKAIEIQCRIEKNQPEAVIQRIRMVELINEYGQFIKHKGMAPKSISKYNTNLDKLKRFVRNRKIIYADQFGEIEFYKFRSWLKTKKHKQGLPYADKTIYAILIQCKQVFKWGWKNRKLSTYALANITLPKARAKPQPCFTTKQVEQLMEAVTEQVRVAIAILAYSGMRVGELVQLEWKDVMLERGQLGMFHIRRGGSIPGKTKSKEERFVPIHPRIRPFIEELPRNHSRVLPDLKARKLLIEVKSACRQCGMLTNFKVHSLRHHFASMCANHNVAHRKALAWLGHSNSNILELYYHLHDDESQSAMMALAADNGWKDGKGMVRQSDCSLMTSN